MKVFDGSSIDFADGMIIVIDKPYTWTSFDVVNKIRYLVKHKLEVKKIKVGHAGTLDPLATGVLVVCTGKATKSIQQFIDDDKEYQATIKFGASTPSLDAETKPDQLYPWKHIDEDSVKQALNKFKGEISQIPPAYSAIKVNGKRAYLSARQGETIEMPPRQVNIHSLEIKKIELPELSINISCSKGTYIRSLARDIGTELKSGAYLTDLKRTKAGNFSINEAIDLKEFEKMLKLL